MNFVFSLKFIYGNGKHFFCGKEADSNSSYPKLRNTLSVHIFNFSFRRKITSTDK